MFRYAHCISRLTISHNRTLCGVQKIGAGSDMDFERVLTASPPHIMIQKQWEISANKLTTGICPRKKVKAKTKQNKRTNIQSERKQTKSPFAIFVYLIR